MTKLQKPIVWGPEQSSGLTRLGDSIERLISVPLGPGAQKFNLYYFVHTASRDRAQSKAVLFCSGGPGQLVRPSDRANTYADFLYKHGYNVVFFHLRGTGVSQIPGPNRYDKFLTTKFAIHDLDAIRRDFLEKILRSADPRWDAVIAWSFGTVLAQRYACEYEKDVKRLILISPLSRHMFKIKEPKDAFKSYQQDALRIYRKSLRQIYDSKLPKFVNEFGDLTENEKDRIINEVFGTDNTGGVFGKTEKAFGSIQFVIDNHSTLSEDEFKKAKSKKFSLSFYERLRDLRYYGYNSIDDSYNSKEQERLIGRRL